MSSSNSSASSVIRTVLAAALAIAVPAEGLRRTAYYDPAGILTVCFGSTTDVEPGKIYSLDECKARLSADMLEAIETVDRCAPGLPVNPRAAFADAVYNLGPTIVCNTAQSTPARLLKARDVRGACERLPDWNKICVLRDKNKKCIKKIALPGLTNRRAAEKAFCLQGLEAKP